MNNKIIIKPKDTKYLDEILCLFLEYPLYSLKLIDIGNDLEGGHIYGQICKVKRKIVICYDCEQ